MVRDIPSKVAGSTLGYSEAQLRDFRSAGFIDHLGERQGKTMAYSVAELLEMEVACFLFRHGLRRGAAYAITRQHARQIHAATSAQATGDQFLMITIDDQLRDGYAAQISDASGAELNGSTAVLGLNLYRISNDLAARLQKQIAAVA